MRGHEENLVQQQGVDRANLNDIRQAKIENDQRASLLYDRQSLTDQSLSAVKMENDQRTSVIHERQNAFQHSLGAVNAQIQMQQHQIGAGSQGIPSKQFGGDDRMLNRPDIHMRGVGYARSRKFPSACAF